MMPHICAYKGAPCRQGCDDDTCHLAGVINGVLDEEEDVGEIQAVNPKQAMGDLKINLAVVPPSAVIVMAQALQYGAFSAPRADGRPPGYGPFDWRESKVA